MAVRCNKCGNITKGSTLYKKCKKCGNTDLMLFKRVDDIPKKSKKMIITPEIYSHWADIIERI